MFLEQKASEAGPLAETAPAILEQLVHQAERAGASDIHLQMRGKMADTNLHAS